MPNSTRRGRFLLAIGSPSAVRFIFVGMFVYAIIIGSLMLGYARVQGCLSDYSDQAAASTKGRSEAAAEDRRLDAREALIDESDRERMRADQAAMLKLLQTAATATQEEKLAAFKELIDTNTTSAEVLAHNDAERDRITAARQASEAKRAANPVPEPPSEIC